MLLATLQAAEEPQPVPPVPSERQLAWHRWETYAFVHFGINTFTGREWGDGKEDPRLFQPTDFDPDQWMAAFRAAGLRTVILTAKHHDGFCLWPSRRTTHSVAGSPWRGGKGDVVREVAEACRRAGLRFGIYLSPWDRHEPTYGRGKAYNDFYISQLTELLTQYGPIAEVWFDGACGEGPNGKRQEYDWRRIRATVRRLQPQAVMFSDAGPDVRWIGNESGVADETNWCLLEPSRMRIGQPNPGQTQGHPDGSQWVPGECDVSIRPGWFHHPEEDAKVKTPDELVELYFRSVGRGASLLLNVPPDRRGRLADPDVASLMEFGRRIRSMFREDVLRGSRATASGVWRGRDRFGPDKATDGDEGTYWAADEAARSGWLEADLGRERTIDCVEIREPIRLGQRVARFRVSVASGAAWRTVAEGTTVGPRRLLRFDPVSASRVRLEVLEARGCPLIQDLRAYRVGQRE
ncbi:MAG: alpha-L-fucosidase [Fimbriimonadales bacterium]|nr:alpha-L-fucosidase [Fimbriimonadales bacterium]